MINLTQPIQAKYTNAILAGPPTIHQDAALLALRLALADLDECWADEHNALQQRHQHLQGQHTSLQEHADRLQAGLNQVSLENDTWEADNIRLRKHYADSERNYEISRLLANEAREVRTAIRTYLLPHLTTPHGAIALDHLTDGHWAERVHLLDGDGAPLDQPAISPSLIALADAMFEHLKQQNAELYGQCTALEAECNRLRASTTASSQPTPATTVSPAPAASNTSNPPAPTPPSPAASPTASAATAAPASSATTSPPKPGRPSTPKPPKTPTPPEPVPSGRLTLEPNPSPEPAPVPSGRLTLEEAGQNTTLDPTQAIDWTTALHGVIPDVALQRLDDGTLKWRQIEKSVQTQLILAVCRTIHHRIGDLSQAIFEHNRPHWMTSVGSWTNTLKLSWRQVLQTIDVQPSNRPLVSRIGNSATNS